MKHYFKFAEVIANTVITELQDIALQGKQDGKFSYPTVEQRSPINEFLGTYICEDSLVYGLCFFRKIREQFNCHPPCFLELPGSNWFAWHHDLTRSASINIPLDDYNSHTIFSLSDSASTSCMIEVCDYELGRATCLNTKVKHAVLNLSDKPRYILSIGLGNTYTYEQLLNYCQLHNLV